MHPRSREKLSRGPFESRGHAIPLLYSRYLLSNPRVILRLAQSTLPRTRLVVGKGDFFSIVRAGAAGEFSAKQFTASAGRRALPVMRHAAVLLSFAHPAAECLFMLIEC